MQSINKNEHESTCSILHSQEINSLLEMKNDKLFFPHELSYSKCNYIYYL